MSLVCKQENYLIKRMKRKKYNRKILKKQNKKTLQNKVSFQDAK